MCELLADLDQGHRRGCRHGVTTRRACQQRHFAKHVVGLQSADRTNASIRIGAGYVEHAGNDDMQRDKMGTGYATLWNAFKRITAGCAVGTEIPGRDGRGFRC